MDDMDLGRAQRPMRPCEARRPFERPCETMTRNEPVEFEGERKVFCALEPESWPLSRLVRAARKVEA